MGNRAQTSGRRIGRRIATLLTLAGLFVLVFLGGSAFAAKVNTYSQTVGEGELSLAPQSGIGVNQETGEVYVADTKHSRVAKFTEGGSADGTLATITEPSFVAVDNSEGPSKGDIYVVGESFATVTKLSPLGLPVSGWGTEELGARNGRLTGLAEIAGIAVDSQGHLWVFTKEGTEPGKKKGTMREFDQADAGQEAEAGTTVSEFTVHVEGEPLDPGNRISLFQVEIGLHGIAVGPEHVYAFKDFEQKSATLLQLTLDGKAAEAFPADLPNDDPGSGSYLLPGRANGVTIDPSGGDVYVSEGTPTSGTVPTFEPPDIERFTSAGPSGRGAGGFETFGGAYEGLRRDGCEIEVINGSETECEVLDGLEAIGSLAIRSSTGTVYALDPLASDVAVYTREEVEPPSVTLDSPGSVGQTSAEMTGHINPNASLGSSRAHEVLWRFECAPGCPEQASGHFEADGQEHTVTATVEGLEAGTKYLITLVAENRGGKGHGTEEVVTAPAPPGAKTGLASEVTPSEATLNAKVNSNGAAATYHFEYATKAAFEAEGFAGAQKTPESAPLPALAEPHEVSERIAGLEPATEYVFRVVAVNSLGTTNGAPESFRSQLGPNVPETECPNQSLRTGPGARLPDCRAYELASPADKKGTAVEPFESWLQTAADGSAVTWATSGTATGVPSPGGAAHQESAFYLSSADAAGWSSQRLLPPEAYGEGGYFSGLTDDGRYAVLETSVGRGGEEPGLYLLDTADQAVTAIVPPVGGAKQQKAFVFDGASGDDRLFFFESELPLTANAAPDKDNLYLWNRETGDVSLAGILPGVKNEAPAGGSFGGAYAWWPLGAGDTSAGGGERGLYVGAAHAISDSGDSVYFTSAGAAQLYLRRGLTGSKPTTIRISVANSGVNDFNGEQPAAFQEATPNGEKAFFLSAGKLTQDANTGPSDEGSDLYRYDAVAKKLVDVAPLSEGAGARVQGLVGIAEDGKSGYFAAQGVLAAGGVEGMNNLYHFEEQVGGGFAYTFVAALKSGEGSNWSPNGLPSGTNIVAKTGRVSSDGGTLLFMSTLSLNGEPQGHCIYGSCSEVYRYSMGESALTCLSCNPSNKGLPWIGAELFPELAPYLIPANFPFAGSLPRNLSSSGARVFFETSESLLPEDVNGQGCTGPAHCVDVYEWEADSTGSCKDPNVGNGCLFLLSSGESGRSSYFAGASEEGEDAFLITDSPLVPADGDQLADMYDVRVDGGLPAQHVTPSQPCGSREACKETSSTPTPVISPGTQSFQGPGNPKSTQCRKGFVRKHGRCVKAGKHHRRKRHHQRHAGGAK